MQEGNGNLDLNMQLCLELVPCARVVGVHDGEMILKGPPHHIVVLSCAGSQRLLVMCAGL